MAKTFTLKTRKRISSALIAVMVLSLIALTVPTSAFAEGGEGSTTVLIANHDEWKYIDTGVNLFGEIATDFRSKNFDDGTWPSAPSPLGYPETDTSPRFGPISGGTVITKGAQGASSSTAYITYYFRKDFTVENIANMTALSADISIDDGYVLYLNGHEVSRLNVPEGDLSYTTVAPGNWEPTEEQANVTVDLSAYRQYLVEGENTLAADVHNRATNSSDIYWGMSLTATYGEITPPTDVNKTPKQVNVHMGDDPSDAVNVTYTTVASDDAKIVIEKADGTGEALTYAGETTIGESSASNGQGGKYLHKINVTGLESDTDYVYAVGNAMTFAGQFKTAPTADSEDPIRFVYLADTQVSNATNAKALGATLQEVANMDPDFVYLAGDITDTAANESQWEYMFSNGGAFPTGGEEMFGNYLISAVQGNHDNNTFNRHINAPTLESGSVTNRIVYSYDYGPLTFIGLNLEAAHSNASAKTEQETFLRAAVADAKARGQWTAVGFHKSLVTGASHITDSDVVTARKFWLPIFAELDVDMVLQGHDHVYSRGFVNELGYKADRTTNADGSINKPENAPLYMIGGHAGGLKWYSWKNYAVGAEDPIAPGYTFLDIDSASTDYNFDGVEDGPGSDVKQEQVIVEMEVSETEVEVKTYMFKYNTDSDTITTPKYLYDTMTMVRDEPVSAEITGSELAVVDTNEDITYTVAYNNIVNANAFDTTIEYDEDVLEFVSAASAFPEDESLVNSIDEPADNQVRVITGIKTLIPQADKQDVVTYTFKAKQPVPADLVDTTVTLVSAETVNATISNGAIVEPIKKVNAVVEGEEAKATTTFYRYANAADVLGDGSVDIKDLSYALGEFQSTAYDPGCDIDRNGVVDTLDFIIISHYILQEGKAA
ncbi:MAG: metallophosphoesterase [Clostridiales Family XIII bacterium]|jgi:hypothetical protein|nr:metallophosphoesterase [Clostridiales Family XIII bacterium]